MPTGGYGEAMGGDTAHIFGMDDTGRYGDLTIRFRDSDEPWSADEFVEGSPLKRGLRRRFGML